MDMLICNLAQTKLVHRKDKTAKYPILRLQPKCFLVTFTDLSKWFNRILRLGRSDLTPTTYFSFLAMPDHAEDGDLKQPLLGKVNDNNNNNNNGLVGANNRENRERLRWQVSSRTILHRSSPVSCSLDFLPSHSWVFLFVFFSLSRNSLHRTISHDLVFLLRGL